MSHKDTREPDFNIDALALNLFMNLWRALISAIGKELNVFGEVK